MNFHVPTWICQILILCISIKVHHFQPLEKIENTVSNDIKLTNPVLVGTHLLFLKWEINSPNSGAISYEVTCKGKMQDGTNIDVTVEPAKNMSMVMLQRGENTTGFLFKILVKLKEDNSQSYEVNCTGESEQSWKCSLVTKSEAEKETQTHSISPTSESSSKTTIDDKTLETVNAKTNATQIVDSEIQSKPTIADTSIATEEVALNASKAEESKSPSKPTTSDTIMESENLVTSISKIAESQSQSNPIAASKDTEIEKTNTKDAIESKINPIATSKDTEIEKTDTKESIERGGPSQTTGNKSADSEKPEKSVNNEEERKVSSGPTSDDKITDAKKFETSESKEEEREVPSGPTTDDNSKDTKKFEPSENKEEESISVTTPVLPDENSKEEVEEGSGASVKSPVEDPDSVERESKVDLLPETSTDYNGHQDSNEDWMDSKKETSKPIESVGNWAGGPLTFMLAIVIVVLAYFVYQNRNKIKGFIVEGYGDSRTARYRRLPKTVEDAMSTRKHTA